MRARRSIFLCLHGSSKSTLLTGDNSFVRRPLYEPYRLTSLAGVRVSIDFRTSENAGRKKFPSRLRNPVHGQTRSCLLFLICIINPFSDRKELHSAKKSNASESWERIRLIAETPECYRFTTVLLRLCDGYSEGIG